MRGLLIGGVLIGGVSLGVTPAAARPFTIEDLLAEESLGAADIDPSGRWAVFEVRDRYDSLTEYRYGLRMEIALSRLRVAELRGAGPARPLLASDVGPGVVMAGFSPSGRTLAVYRLSDGRWTLGLVDMASGRTRWLDVAPDWRPPARTLQWVSDETLVVLARTDGRLPWILRQFGVGAERYPDRWAATRRGEASVTALGSGAWLGLRPRAAPRQLLRIDARTGAVRPLASGDFTDLEASPDGRHVALFEAGQDLQPRAGGPAQGGAGLQTEASGLALLDLETGQRRDPLPGVDLLPNLLAWSPRGRSLLVYGRTPGDLWTTGSLRVVDAASGGSRRVGTDLVLDMTLRPEVLGAGWMGEDPVAYGRAPGAARSDWYRLEAGGPINLTRELPAAPRTLAALDPGGLLAWADGAMWRVDPGGLALRVGGGDLAPAPRARTTIPGRLDFAPPAESWLAAADGSAGRRLVRAAGGGLSSTRLRPGAGNLLAVSRTADAALVRRQDGAGRLQLLGVTAAGERVLADLNRPFADVAAPQVRPVRHLGPSGEALTSWMFLPAGRGGPPPPLVIVPYAGLRYPAPPRDYLGEPGYPVSLRLLTGQGYAVLMPSLPHGPDGEPMTALGPRLEAIVAAAAGQPELAGAFDPDRMALWGFSFGGYSVAAALAQSDAFRAGVAVAGPMEFVSKWASISPIARAAPDEGLLFAWTSGNMENGQNRMGAPPWADPERYRRNSPFMAADRIRAPLLLAHGDQDSIDLQQSEAMFAALFRQARDAILLTYWGESHGFASPGNIRDFYARAFAFLDAQLDPLIGSSGSSPGHRPPESASTAPRPPWTPPKAAAPPPDGR
jgi:dipeptidyl aminopeptidase/acylaminoacyl peptidase